jgi:hypothetical protein
MPYHLITQDGKTCVAKEGEDMPIPGGCHDTEEEARVHMAALYANEPDASKAENETALEGVTESYVVNYAVKAVGDWELDVLAIPFGGRDSDGQYFDANTDLMLDAFPTPVPVYYHSLKEGTKDFDSRPIVLGQTAGVTQQPDGIHARVILNKAIAQAAKVWEAAKQGLAVASSGTIKHLARLDLGGRLVPYDKGTPGRIAVWPFGELSLWDSGPGMARQAHPYALATPALKMVYEQAGIALPESIDLDTDSTEAEGKGEISRGPAAKRESGKETKPKRTKKVDTEDTN